MRISFVSVAASVLCLVFLGGCSILKMERPTMQVASTSAKTSKPYDSIISHYAVLNGVPVDLAHAVVFL